MTITDILAWLIEKRADLVVVAFFILYGGHKKYWVYGYQLEDMTKDRDFWRNTATSGTSLAKQMGELIVKK